MTFYGADVSQLRALAKAVDQAASLLSSRAGSLQGQIQSAPWKGADGARFRQDWSSSHRPNLEKVVSSLRANSKILMKHADEQEKSSNSSGGGGGGGTWDKIKSLAGQARDWLQEQAAAAAAAAEHRKELESGLDKMLNASPEEQAKWWASLSEADRKYLIEGEGENGPFAKDLMRMDGGIPESAQQLAKEHLQELAKADIPVYTETGKASIEARVAWVHGGAEVGTEVVENADGSATMKVYGNMGLGVNDTSGTAGVTLSGEVSREYKFGSVEEAMAARAQMYRDLPPDSIGDIKDVAGNPPGYVLDTINDAAGDNGSTGQTDKAKGTLSLEAEGESGAASGSAKLDLSYERNLTDGTATASGEVSAQGKLNLDGRTFEASGKGGLQVNMDKGNNIDSVTVSMEGTVAQGVTEGTDVKAAKVESSVSAGTQGTVKINVDYTPENRAVVDSYLRNVALGNDYGAARDAAKLYEAGSATVQVNSVVTASNEAGFDVKLGEVEVKTESSATTNVSTYYKVPNDTKLERL
ncbi:hypothetical protein SAMN04489743_3950 [Pseudarthrobacter equi]|uniref:WXG100 family type VII secretion target n=1 Tax=Pseudarthrobacter equi TaxID=728066 RepID=A0A1H2BSX1_9MICC|nr:hypothetical protein [Pseudarthrobacter equi]SDT61308.1 hypothetical protein SAMN04489743_3950 [Pseudarthrobacter equi]